MQDSQLQRMERGEWVAASISFAYFFFVLAAYYVIRPVREQLAAAVGSTQLPWFFAATFVATLALTPVFAWLVSRWPRRIVLPLVYVFFIACLLAFVPLFVAQEAIGARRLGIGFFVWVSVFNLFVVSVFWSFMADIWDSAQARRLFPVIALGGTAGAIVGPVLTRQLVGVIGVPALLLVSAGLLALALVCVLLLGRWARAANAGRPEAAAADARGIGGGMFDGLRQVFADPFIRAMAVLMLMGDVIGTVAYALVADYSGMTFADPVARTRFAANIDLVTNVLQVAVQVTLTRWMLMRYGAGPVIAGWAVAGVLVLFGLMLSSDPHAPVLAGLPWVALVLIVTRGLTYGMVQPARESLYTRVPRSLRYKGKNAVDTAVWRFGDLAVTLGMNALRTVNVGIPGFGAIGAVALGIAGAVGWRLARRVESPAASTPATQAA